MRQILLHLTLVCLAVEAPAQTEMTRQRFGNFSAELPPAWRRMTPDEAFRLRDRLPFVLQTVYPGQYEVVGAIDAWVDGRFDGIALIVTTQTGEIPIDDASIDRIREHWQANPGDGPKRTVLDGQVGTIGKDDHQVVICRVCTDPEPNFGSAHATEYYVPTDGQLLILGFHSWEDPGEKANELFESIVKTASFPRPPKGVEEIGDRIGRALTVGALVGLGLIVLRMLLRRPSKPEESAPNPNL